MRKNKSILWIIISKVLGLIIFLLLLYFANIMTAHIQDPYFMQAVNFLNGNIALIVIISIILLIAELFYAFIFPFNLPAPLFSAIGSVFVVYFMFKIFTFIDRLLEQHIFQAIGWIFLFLYPLIFIIVLVVGYLSIFFGLARKQPEKKPKSKSWEDIGDEFRQLLYDTLSKMRISLKKKSVKKK